MAPAVEKAMVDSGIILVKYWLEVSADEQTRRLESRIDDPRKIWKLSDMDLQSYGRWYDYSRARDDMFAATDTAWAPWFVAHTDDKKRGRLNIISHLLGQVPYEPLPRHAGRAARAPEGRALPGTGASPAQCRRRSDGPAARIGAFDSVAADGQRQASRLRPPGTAEVVPTAPFGAHGPIERPFAA